MDSFIKRLIEEAVSVTQYTIAVTIQVYVCSVAHPPSVYR